MKHRWARVVGAALRIGILFPTLLISQAAQTAPAPGPYARVAIMRAIDGHSVEWEAGYIRHLEWHRQPGSVQLVQLFSVGIEQKGSGGSSTRRSAIQPPS